MSHLNPADAVREAQTFKAVIVGDEALMKESDEGQWIYLHDHLRRIAELEARLAALAGAGPDSPVTIEDLHAASIDLTGGRPSEEVIRELRGHAPAKAREVTEADVARARAAFRAAENADFKATGRLRTNFNASMRAALVTFAEGATG